MVTPSHLGATPLGSDSAKSADAGVGRGRALVSPTHAGSPPLAAGHFFQQGKSAEPMEDDDAADLWANLQETYEAPSAPASSNSRAPPNREDPFFASKAREDLISDQLVQQWLAREPQGHGGRERHSLPGLEVEVVCDFAGGPGEWLPCHRGDIVLAVWSNASADIVYVIAHGRVDPGSCGFVPSDCLKLRSDALWHEFVLRLEGPWSDDSPLGLVWAERSECPELVHGLFVADVIPHSIIASTWNEGLRVVFGRDRLLVGDVIVRVNGKASHSEMADILDNWRQAQFLSLHVVRCGALEIASGLELQGSLLEGAQLRDILERASHSSEALWS